MDEYSEIPAVSAQKQRFRATSNTWVGFTRATCCEVISTPLLSSCRRIESLVSLEAKGDKTTEAENGIIHIHMP